MTWSSSRRLAAAAAAFLVVTLAVTGYLLTRPPSGDGHVHDHGAAAEAYVCPMHPDVRQPTPGRCPICGMALELTTPEAQSAAHQEAHGGQAVAANPARPVQGAAAADGADPRAPVTIDTRRRQLIGVRVAPVESVSLTRQVRARGLVQFDESRWTDINVRTEGWIRRLHVQRTGERVSRGQPLLALYSPELATAQAEYLLALRTRDAMAEAPTAGARDQGDRLVAAARARLARWDLPPDQVTRIEETREAPAETLFRSPVSGIVMEKRAVEGMRVMPGDSLFRVVDNAVVWIEADVYETDLAAVRVGQTARATVDAWPGEAMTGRVTWVAPTLDETTRTARVRLELPNRGERLKPGMFAEVQLASALPATPVVPADAIVETGTRQFVFVSEGDGYFEPRPVRAGARVDGRVQVLEGLSPGEQVAASATFFIDSESQIRAALEGYGAGEPGEGRVAPSGPSLDITLRSTPDPPRAGDTRFEVTVRTPEGQPVADAAVSLVLYMPPMPSMNMPAMRSQAHLEHAGAGVYRGTLDVMMNGRWDATVTVTRGGERIGRKQVGFTAR